MQCPNGHKELQTIEFKGISIQECESCKGHWFNRGELNKAKDHEDEDLRWLDFDPFGKDAQSLSIKSQGKDCPECAEQMDSLKYRESSVIIDKCSDCEGIWLEQGEFHKIIEYLERLILSKPANEYARETFKQFVEIFNGPEGVIGESKDFLAVLHLLQLRFSIEHPKIAELSNKIYQKVPFI